MSAQPTGVQALHIQRVNLLVERDNLESEIISRRGRLKVVRQELDMLREQLKGTEVASLDAASTVAQALGLQGSAAPDSQS